MRKTLALLLALVPFSAASAAETQKIELRFAAVVGDKAFACGQSYEHMGVTGSRITPSDMRFYISQVELLDDRGQATPLQLDQDDLWQVENLALLDFEDGTGPCHNGNPGLHTAITGTVPKGRYRGVRFTLGVPFDLNHADPTIAPSPLNISAMFWAWQSGYKFVKIDMATSGQPQDDMGAETSMKDRVAQMERIAKAAKAAPTDAPKARPPQRAAGFSIHLGSTACASSSLTSPATECRNPNRVAVTFDRFDPATNVIVADLGALVSDTNLDVNAPDSAPGCMSGVDDADCPAMMRAFGLPFGAQPAGKQRFFRQR